jgi:hypothetical protein
MLDSIFDRLISIGYTYIAKDPISSTKSLFFDNLVPTMSPFPGTILILISEPNDSATTLSHTIISPNKYTPIPLKLPRYNIQLFSPATNLTLRRRYVSVQQACDVGAVEIVVETFGKGGHLNLISLHRKK